MHSRITKLAFVFLLLIGVCTPLYTESSDSMLKVDDIKENPDNSVPTIPHPNESAETKICSFIAVDVREWDLTWQETCLLSSVEGLANYDTPQLFVIWDDTQAKWLEAMNTSIYNVTLPGINSLESLCSLFADEMEGLIIFDDLPESKNLATPWIGITRAALVHKDLFSTVAGWAAFTGKSVLKNFTVEYETKGFTSDSDPAEIYRWAFDTWFFQCNQTALALFDSGHNSHLRSFLGINRIFTLWQPLLINIEEATADDRELQDTFEYVIQNTPENMVVYGYMYPNGGNEHPVVRKLCEYGKYLVPSDFINNFPLLHRLPLPEGYTFTQNRDIEMPALENKIYFAGIYSDGDNIQYVANFLFGSLWNSEAHRTRPAPIAYEISPSLAWMAPYLLYYFYENATQMDYFTTGVGGIGYTKAEYFTDSYFQTYFEETRRLMAQTDIRELRSWGGDLAKMAEILNADPANPQCDGIYNGYGGNTFYDPQPVKGCHVMHMFSLDGNTTSEWEFLMSLRELADDPVFVVFHLMCWDAPYAAWADFVENLSQYEEFQCVRLDQMSYLIQQQLTSKPLVFIGIILGLFWAIPIVLLVYLRKKAGLPGSEHPHDQIPQKKEEKV